MDLLHDTLPILVLAGVAATTGVLVLGLVVLAKRGGAGDPRSNKLMRWRLIFQGLTIAVLVLGALIFGVHR